MSDVSFFQKYSQAENVATNNTLLLFRHFYRNAPEKIAGIFNQLLGQELDVGLQFVQQVRRQKSIPDAVISQTPIDIYIETKPGHALNNDQIIRHAKGIIKDGKGKEGRETYLIGLTQRPIGSEKAQALKERVSKIGKIHFVNITFEEVCDAFRDACKDYEPTLVEIVQDYESYLLRENLLSLKRNHLMVVPCGQSFDDNERFQLYHDNPSYARQFCQFLGIYKERKVHYIGKVTAIVICTYRDKKIEWEKPLWGTIGKKEEVRIKDMFENNTAYDLKGEPVRFFVLDGLQKTNFLKSTKNGIQGHRIFNLEDYDKNRILNGNNSAKEVANLLEGESFN